MRSRIYWIESPYSGRLAIMARPRAGDWLDDEIAGWGSDGIDEVVSLLEPEEVADLQLNAEQAICRAHNVGFLSFPIPDRGVPESGTATAALARHIALSVEMGRSIAIHCRAGIGRSSVVAACALICMGVSAEKAFQAISEVRGVGVPDTDQQREWVKAFRATTA